MMNYSLSDFSKEFLERNEKHLKGLLKEETKSKYHNKKTVVDGISFDSQKESMFYSELKIRLQAKDIKGFCRQPEFILIDGDAVMKYYPDFIVWENDKVRIIDVKGMRTQVFINKKKVFEDKFDLKIEEV